MKQCRSVIGADYYFKYSSYTTLVLLFLTAEMGCKDMNSLYTQTNRKWHNFQHFLEESTSCGRPTPSISEVM